MNIKTDNENRKLFMSFLAFTLFVIIKQKKKSGKEENKKSTPIPETSFLMGILNGDTFYPSQPCGPPSPTPPQKRCNPGYRKFKPSFSGENTYPQIQLIMKHIKNKSAGKRGIVFRCVRVRALQLWVHSITPEKNSTLLRKRSEQSSSGQLLPIFVRGMSSL